MSKTKRAKKQNPYAEVLASAGFKCPVCATNRGDSLTWFETALDEFYGKADSVRLFKEHPSDVKQAAIRVGQAISTLGHLHDEVRMPHPKGKHDCAGLLEVGLYQAVELLNRGLLHLVLGHPSTAYPLIRMAAEVGARSVLEQVLHLYLTTRSVVPRRAKKFKGHVSAGRVLVRRSSLEDDLRRCSKNLITFDWPDEALSDRGRPKLDPVALGWEKTIDFLEELGVFSDEALPRTALDGLYGDLSGLVHQRKTAIEYMRNGGDFQPSGEDWVIRGVPPVAPDDHSIRIAQQVADVIMAMMVSARVALEIPCGDLAESAPEWKKRLAEWPMLMPLSLRSLGALVEAEHLRAARAPKRPRLQGEVAAPPAPTPSAPDPTSGGS